jgi:hypothetical protein
MAPVHGGQRLLTAVQCSAQGGTPLGWRLQTPAPAHGRRPATAGPHKGFLHLLLLLLQQLRTAGWLLLLLLLLLVVVVLL